MKPLKFILVLCFTVFCDAIPLASNKFNFPFKANVSKNLNLINEMDKNSAPSLLWKSSNNVMVGNKLNDESVSYRLPNNTIPVRYDLWLKTDVKKAEFGFSGRVKIHVKIIETTQKITLQYRQIKVDKIDLLGTERNLIQSNLDFEYEENVEFLIISLPRTVIMNDEVVLAIDYHGELRDDASGFYRASYQRNDSPDEKVWFATTQFEMTDARHAMPCFDEPGIRAIMNVEIQHDKSYNAISNMPIVSREEVTGTDYVTSKFQDSPPMQTYLLAFIVSDFKFITNNDVNVEQRIYAKPQSIDRGEGQFALSIIDPILRKLEKYFGINFPLPKMDHAAITDFNFGAMENFGLITYREGALLFQPESPDYLKKGIIEIVTHEFVHQYFGNIVNPKWWSYTWLNEGFANLFQYYIPSLIYPEEDYMERMQTYSVEPAFSLDFGDTKTMNSYVESPNEVSSKFGVISYQKSGSVLRMFQEALTVQTFTKGLKYYLNAMYY